MCVLASLLSFLTHLVLVPPSPPPVHLDGTIPMPSSFPLTDSQVTEQDEEMGDNMNKPPYTQIPPESSPEELRARVLEFSQQSASGPGDPNYQFPPTPERAKQSAVVAGKKRVHPSPGSPPQPPTSRIRAGSTGKVTTPLPARATRSTRSAAAAPLPSVDELSADLSNLGGSDDIPEDSGKLAYDFSDSACDMPGSVAPMRRRGRS